MGARKVQPTQAQAFTEYTGQERYSQMGRFVGGWVFAGRVSGKLCWPAACAGVLPTGLLLPSPLSRPRGHQPFLSSSEVSDSRSLSTRTLQHRRACMRCCCAFSSNHYYVDPIIPFLGRSKASGHLTFMNIPGGCRKKDFWNLLIQ